jgi:hypothetical protein
MHSAKGSVVHVSVLQDDRGVWQVLLCDRQGSDVTEEHRPGAGGGMSDKRRLIDEDEEATHGGYRNACAGRIE